MIYINVFPMPAEKDICKYRLFKMISSRGSFTQWFLYLYLDYLFYWTVLKILAPQLFSTTLNKSGSGRIFCGICSSGNSFFTWVLPINHQTFCRFMYFSFWCGRKVSPYIYFSNSPTLCSCLFAFVESSSREQVTMLWLFPFQFFLWLFDFSGLFIQTALSFSWLSHTG